MAEIAVGQVRTGTVKNLADFGAFVDLGGIDGLLHITDMGWERLKHPSERLRVDDQIEVMILNVDKERGKIALGLKQLTANPWEQVAEKYPVGARVTGEVVNVMSYGAFVKLEPGVEGLVHVSEMSWTRRINHPSEVAQAGDQVEVVVLGINQQKREISLGMKQTQADPWDLVAEKYPPGTDGRGHRPQPHQLRRVRRGRGGHRRPPARLRHELDPQDRPPQRGPGEGPDASPARSSTSTRSASGSPWA